MRLTARGIGLGLSSVALGTWGVHFGHPLVLLLGVAGAAAVLASLAVTSGKVDVEPERDIHPAWVEAGQAAVAQIVVRNTTSRRSPAVVARDRRDDAEEMIPVPGLAPGRSSRHTYSLPTRRRGRLVIGPVAFEREDAFGLARNRVLKGETSVLHVHPRLHAAGSVAAGVRKHSHEGLVELTSQRGAAELRSLREYVTGDEPRHVHWKASARTGKLMVRDMVDPDEVRCTVVLDDRAEVFEPDLFEAAVEVAASLAHASALDDLHTRVRMATGADVGTTGGAVGSRKILEVLSEVGQSAEGFRLDGLGGGSAGHLVFVSHRPAPDVIASLTRWGATTTVIDLAGDPAAENHAGVRRIVAADAASAVALWNRGGRG
ncbi:hypothetical protein GCM10011609_02640 [Lentzea pudingi]|uniref:DUF58 domain-containing protein n=1 Tax=Lentzea pudingi TaxID=1789439 RepID=A0ABQ2HBS6_9PSEU|nr:DUF58 domain-containing protein [Lentzea pudingi]GGM70436.1 hypothetical protein GCM10011609_02640 [Lentzea pudingi]